MSTPVAGSTAPMKPPRPVPVPDAASAPFFEGARAGRLMLMRCLDCGAWRYPARDRCDRCWSDRTGWEQASGRGTVYTFGIMHHVYHPAYAALIPYNVVVVELEEGVRMTSAIVGCADDAIHVGMPVTVTFEQRSETVWLPIFRPA